jgi:glycosyltransferase involved in cell wall biosynthesis
LNTILFITSGLKNGGAEFALKRLIQSTFIHRNIKIFVFNLDAESPISIDLKAKGINVLDFNFNSNFTLSSIYNFFSALNQISPNQIHGWMYHGNLLAFIAWIIQPKAELIFNVRQALHSLKQEKFSTRIVILMNALLSKFCLKVTHNSKIGISHHREIGFCTTNSIYIPNGFNHEKLYPSLSKRTAFRKLHDIPQKTCVITLLARYDPIKGHDIFLNAAKILLLEVPDVIFLMVGEGLSTDNSKLSKLITDIASNLIILGHQDDILSVLNGSDILTVSSHSEGFPNVLGEGMAVGLNCVATNVGGCAEILGNCGRISPPGDPSSLAACWLNLLLLPKEEFRIEGLRARKRIVDFFSAEKFINSYMHIFTL